MNRRAGFSLFELIIVIGILAFSLRAAFLVFNNQLFGNLASDASILSSRLQDAQARAIAGNAGTSWGLHIDNATATPFYAVFAGTSYSSASSTYYLSSFVQFSQPVSGTTTDIVFNKLTGTLATTTSIILKLRTNASSTETITVSAAGQINVAGSAD